MYTLASIRARALALRSTIHNEQQLSTLELCGMVAKKTNELIDLVNELTDILENQKFEYDPKTETLSLTIGGNKE